MSAITIYGTTGMIGQDITREAARRGHSVTGVSRHAPENPVEGVTYERGDLADTGDFVRRAAGSDVVVVSVPPDRTGGPHEPYLQAHRGIIAAAPSARLVVLGGAGSLHGEDGARLVDSPGFPEAYVKESRTASQMLELYRADGARLDWVIVSPSPEIGPGEASAERRIGGDEPVGDYVSSGTLAAAVLDEIKEPSVRNARFTVANA
ncbi:NAD(P)-dependent oxidoreductase [Pseudactinotalea sp. HY158]|uniref:NAD(P)-dependent oxidoreductase n=1 Tax=Pseudactinotalea sp. HY158 TaxID=2654547 RepID=UPI00129C1A79|nr:NAD(P)H-binding protein [Pseudactinotalea sp. HY158]QGH69046.1 NAD(P)H-binding protein [Pseudactinotalea sp. HY158]